MKQVITFSKISLSTNQQITNKKDDLSYWLSFSLVISVFVTLLLFDDNNCYAQAGIQNLFFNSKKDIVQLNFASSSPTITNTGIAANNNEQVQEGIIHYEDGNGKVIFLFNTNHIYNRNGEVMPGSTGILANSSSTELNVCPVPNQPNQYYIFYNELKCSFLYYSIIDMSLQSGLGDVVELNTQITTNHFAEGIEIVRIPCSNNYWLIAYDCDSGFHRFLIDNQGVSSSELIHEHTAPFGFQGQGELDYHLGKIGMAFVSAPKIFVADFDPLTGKIDNARTPNNGGFLNSYGLEFSPDATKMYVSLWYTRGLFAPTIYQFDLTDDRYHRYQLSVEEEIEGLGQIELGSDGKLYIAQDRGKAITVIPNPNENTPIFESISLDNKIALGISDPIQSDVFVDKTVSTICVNPQENVTLIPDNQEVDYIWVDMQMPNDTLAIASTFSLVYHKQVQEIRAISTACSTQISMFVYTFNEQPQIDLIPEIEIIEGESVLLENKLSAAAGLMTNYQCTWWPADGLDDPNSTNPLAMPKQTTTYTLTVTNGSCISTDSIEVIVLPPLPISLPSDSICVFVNKQFILQAPENWSEVDWYISNDSIAQIENSHDFAILGGEDITIYVAKGKDIAGQLWEKRFVILPNFSIDVGSDQTIVAGEWIDLHVTGGSNYTWTSSALPEPTLDNRISISPNETTSYTVSNITTEGCLATDEVVVFVEEKTETEVEVIEWEVPEETKQLSKFLVPTAFSPNNDGHNDILHAFPQNIATFHYFRIFNRWGVLVFETDLPDEGWDGFYKGKAQPLGAYQYEVAGETLDGEIQVKMGRLLLIK